MSTLKSKLSTVTTISENSFAQINNYLNLIHSNDIVDQLLQDKDIFELELFEGTLYISMIDDMLKYKFIPNENFSKIIKESIINRKSALVSKVSQRLKSALLNTYKDIL